ncbi:hypothetical protein [Maribacter sp. 2-571]|uniref:hypothetical protein n=1 Tax=Maribacter sp. 2-571 TaxID=3417569 RepID=UPI003D336FB0
MNIPGQLSSRIPINFAISQSGNQEISITILPIFGKNEIEKNVKLTFNIECFDAWANMEYNSNLYQYESPEIKISKPIPILKKIESLAMDVPYILDKKWKEGETLTDVKKIRQKLTRTYLELGNIIQNQQFDSFKEMLKNREKTMATSMYLSTQESENRIKRLILDFQNGFNVFSVAKEAAVVYSAYGKKAALKKLNGEPALTFSNIETKEELMLDLEFYLPKNSEEFHII